MDELLAARSRHMTNLLLHANKRTRLYCTQVYALYSTVGELFCTGVP